MQQFVQFRYTGGITSAILACTRRALNAEDLYPCLGQSYRVVTTLKVGAAKLSHAQGSFLGRQVQVNHSITHIADRRQEPRRCLRK